MQNVVLVLTQLYTTMSLTMITFLSVGHLS